MSYVISGTAENVVSRMPSPAIWNDCPAEAFDKNVNGRRYFNDFHQTVVGGSTLVLGQPGGLTAFLESDAAGDLAIAANDEGHLQVIADGTDADVYAVTSGDNVGGVWKTPAAGAPHRLWFEARFKVSQVADAHEAIYVGLCAPGEAKNAGGAFAASGASLSDVDYVGFAVLAGDGDALTAVYNEATSGTAQSNAAATLVADTFVRVGFRVEFTRDAAVNGGGNAQVQFYVDGVALGDSKAVDISQANANWPGATDMDLLLSQVSAASAADSETLTVDWVQIAQEY